MRETKKMKIGLIGCGAIGSQLAKAVSQDRTSPLMISALTDAQQEKAISLAGEIKPKPRVMTLLQAAEVCDVLVEAAGKQTVMDIAQAALRYKKKIVVLSIGALIENPALFEKFRQKKCGLFFPSGAISGLDALKAGATGKLYHVKLQTRKHPRSLAGAPFFIRKKMNPGDIKKATRIFSGSAKEAIQLFPANVNVAAAVSLVGIGAEKTRVEIIADPRTRHNTHTLQVKGDFGQFTTVTENLPSRENPKTSYLAAAAALALLNAIARDERFGT